MLLRRLPLEGDLHGLPLHHGGRWNNLPTASWHPRSSVAIVRSDGLPRVLQATDSDAIDFHWLRSQLGLCMLRPNMRFDVRWGAHCPLWVSCQLDNRLHVHCLWTCPLLVLHHGLHLFARPRTGLQTRPHWRHHPPLWYYSPRHLHHPLFLRTLPLRCVNNRKGYEPRAGRWILSDLSGFLIVSEARENPLLRKERCPLWPTQAREWRWRCSGGRSLQLWEYSRRRRFQAFSWQRIRYYVNVAKQCDGRWRLWGPAQPRSRLGFNGSESREPLPLIKLCSIWDGGRYKPT